jgi:hypothetical protein
VAVKAIFQGEMLTSFMTLNADWNNFHVTRRVPLMTIEAKPFMRFTQVF